MYATFLNGIMIFLRSSFLLNVFLYFIPMFLVYFAFYTVGYFIYGFLDN